MKEKLNYKQELEKVFRYNAKKNTLERRLKDGRWKIVNSRVAKGSNGYVNVNFNGRMILVHRVIFTLVNGNIPEGVTIDHIDNIKTNNNINNLQLLSNRDNVAKGRGGLNPCFRKDNQSYIVQELVRFGGKQHPFYFCSFKVKVEADKFSKAYHSQFAYGMPFYKARLSTPEYWRSCLQTFKGMYFNNKESI